MDMNTKKGFKFGRLLMLSLAVILATSLVLSTGVMAYIVSGDGEIHRPQSTVQSSEEVREIEVEMGNFELAPDEFTADAGEEVKFIVDNPTAHNHTFTVYSPQEDQEYAIADAKIDAGEVEEVTVEMPEENLELLVKCYFHQEDDMMATIAVQ